MKFPPPSATEIDAVQRELGYRLPASLLNMYAARGNGGFGPDYGLLGLGSGHVTDLGDTAISLYRAFRTQDPDAPTHVWPDNLLPILHIRTNGMTIQQAFGRLSLGIDSVIAKAKHPEALRLLTTAKSEVLAVRDMFQENSERHTEKDKAARLW